MVGLTTGVLLLAALVSFCSVGEVAVVKVGVAPVIVGVTPPNKDKVEPVSDWLRLS